MARSRRPALRGQVDLAIRILQRWAGEVKDAASKEDRDVQLTVRRLSWHVLPRSDLRRHVYVCERAVAVSYTHLTLPTILLV